MKKYIILFITMLMLMSIPTSVYALTYPELNSKKIEVYDLNDKKILYEKNINDKASIASLTKITTIITAIENIKNLDEEVTITNDILATVAPEASVAGLQVGDKITYKDLLYGAMLPSGADATNALAILTSESIDNFVNKMNELATKLKLKNTHYVNVTGLDEDNHYSTVDDVRIVLEYALKNETFKEIYKTKEYKMSNGKTVKSTLYKYNVDNTTLEKILGTKTGYTGDAGHCLSSLANINDHEVIIIVLNAKKPNHIMDTNTLIDYLRENYKYETLVEKKQLIKTLPVELSKTKECKIYSDKEIKKYLPSDYDKKKLKIKYNGIDKLSFQNKKGKSIGTIKYYYDKELLYKQNVILNKEINLDFIKLIQKYYLVIIGIIVLLIAFIFIKRKKKKKRH